MERSDMRSPQEAHADATRVGGRDVSAAAHSLTDIPVMPIVPSMPMSSSGGASSNSTTTTTSGSFYPQPGLASPLSFPHAVQLDYFHAGLRSTSAPFSEPNTPGSVPFDRPKPTYYTPHASPSRAAVRVIPQSSQSPNRQSSATKTTTTTTAAARFVQYHPGLQHLHPETQQPLLPQAPTSRPVPLTRSYSAGETPTYQQLATRGRTEQRAGGGVGVGVGIGIPRETSPGFNPLPPPVSDRILPSFGAAEPMPVHPEELFTTFPPQQMLDVEMPIRSWRQPPELAAAEAALGKSHHSVRIRSPSPGAHDGSSRSPPGFARQSSPSAALRAIPAHRMMLDDTGTVAAQAAQIRALEDQIKKSFAAWATERKHMEENRARAEDVYQGQLRILESHIERYEIEKQMTLAWVRRLEETIRHQGGMAYESLMASGDDLNPSWLRTEVAAAAGYDSSALRGGEVGELPASGDGHHCQQAVSFRAVVSPPTPSKSRTASGAAVMVAGPPPPPPPQPDFLVTSDPVDAQVDGQADQPTVDVQQIHPELEGIPIKSRAINKATFRDGVASPSSSGGAKQSPPSRTSPTRDVSGDSPPKTRTVSREQTLQLLAAGEDQRLTMHAGHTPSHSLSFIPTAVGSDGVNTTTSSGSGTPCLMITDVGGVGGSSGHNKPAEGAANDDASSEKKKRQLSPPLQHGNAFDEEAMYDTADDVALNGPLMVRNIPAKDEIFFRKLSEKLADVVKTDDAPTVLKGPSGSSSPLPQAAHNAADANAAAAAAAAADITTMTIGDGTNDNGDQSSPGGWSKVGDEDEEEDVPLKLKPSNNFGAPFGALRQFAFR